MRSIALGMTLALTACGGGATVDSTSPPPASPGQVAAFCERFEEVRDEQILDMYESLLEVAPPELEAPLTRLTDGPDGGTYWADRDAVEDFMDRCET